ncbi:MAG: YncE family protein [Thermomicrobiales bacterium]|nr:YncE family protein [Thermomicrobiales bacterium]
MPDRRKHADEGHAMARRGWIPYCIFLSLLFCLVGPTVGASSLALHATATPISAGCTSENVVNASPVAAGSNEGVPVAATPENVAVLSAVADIPLPGGATRFDYLSLDPTTGRLWIAHMGTGQVVVFDTVSRSVIGTVDDLPTVTGVLAVPELHRVYASVAGEHHVAVIDDQTLKVVARLGKIDFPDGLAYAPGSGRVFISDESGGGELVLDATTDSVVTTIDIGGEAGNTQYDAGSGCVVVAVQSRNELAIIDPVAAEIVDRLSLDTRCEGPHGFVIDSASRLAFVTCEGNATLLVVDVTSKRVTATHAVGNGPDVLAFDPGLKWLYVAAEAGVVSVFAEQNGALQRVGEYRAPHGHSVAVDPATHLVYLPLEDVDGEPVLRIMKPGP